MENNVIEFKYDKVIEYFENFKQKYADNYEENKIKGTKIVKDYYSLILSPNEWNSYNSSLSYVD